LIRLDQLSAAEEQLRAAAQLAPQSPQPQLALGRVAIDRRDFAAAQSCFQQAASIAPYCREAREQLARANFLLGDHEQAERDQKLAGSLPPAYPGLEDPILLEVNQRELVARQSAERADRLAASGDMAAATRAFQRMIEDRPELSRPRLNLATLAAMRGDMQSAAAMYREIVELFPSEALAYQGLGAVLEGAGDVDGAIAAYRECVRLKPDYAQAYHALGLLWEQKGNFEEAVSSYRAAINADARFAPACLSLGLALQKLGELDSAVSSIENAVRLAPNDAVPRGYLQRARQAQQKQSVEGRQDSNRENKGENANDQR
jgi:tetratricopeptide (TPR) repeat protein